MRPVGAHGGEVVYFWSICFKGDLAFLNCDDICMCVVNKQFEFLEFVYDSVCRVVLVPYVDAVVAVTRIRVLLCCMCVC